LLALADQGFGGGLLEAAYVTQADAESQVFGDTFF
jgi:hypothetical protein